MTLVKVIHGRLFRCDDDVAIARGRLLTHQDHVSIVNALFNHRLPAHEGRMSDRLPEEIGVKVDHRLVVLFGQDRRARSDMTDDGISMRLSLACMDRALAVNCNHALPEPPSIFLGSPSDGALT